MNSVALGASAVSRTYGFMMHKVQLRAAILGSLGKTLQMQTGEGKSVVSLLIAFARSHFERVHVATTNAYLAARDYEKSKPFFDILSSSSGLVTHDQNNTLRQEAYRKHVTFGPGYQFGFDYLADQLSLRRIGPETLGTDTLVAIGEIDIEKRFCQPADFGTVVVDEADSVMIDEANTPLILSGQGKDEDLRPYLNAQLLAETLGQESDFVIDELRNSVRLTNTGLERVFGFHQQNCTTLSLVRPWQDYVTNAIYAEKLLARNDQYVVQDSKIKIVDPYTGRIFEDRQWQAGLHQAVEAKEGVPVNMGNQTLAQITRQSFFQRYNNCIGLSGTLEGLERELKSTYQMSVVKVPTNRPCRRKKLRNRFFASFDAKVNAIATEVADRCNTGQPVLIGTRTIAQSYEMQRALETLNIRNVLLNGLQDQEEAEVIENAGHSGSVTIATNMAGRGTDIKLDDDARKAGGLFVVGFEHNASSRIDRQLIGRCARQGGPGVSRFFVSAEDELIAMKNPRLASRIRRSARKNGESAGDFSAEISHIQRQEDQDGRKRRAQLTRYGNWLNKVRTSMVVNEA